MWLKNRNLEAIFFASVIACIILFFNLNNDSILAIPFGILAFGIGFSFHYYLLSRLISKIPKKIRTHYLPMLILLLVVIIFLRVYVDSSMGGLVSGDALYLWNTYGQVQKHTLSEFGEIPLWNPYWYGGYPFLMVADRPGILYFPYYIKLLFPVDMSINLSRLFICFFAGLGMYFFVYYIKKDKWLSLLSAIIFALSGGISTQLIDQLPYARSGAFFPWILLFGLRALKEKKVIRESVLLGIFFAASLHAGGTQYFLFAALFLALLYAYLIIGSKPIQTIKRLIVIGIIVGIIFGGLAMLKVLPTLEFVEHTNRNNKVEFDRQVDGVHAMQHQWLMCKLVHNNNKFNPDSTITFDCPGDPAAVGFIVAMIIIFSLISFSKRYALFFLIIAAVAVILSYGGALYKFIWYNLPMFDRFRYPDRFLLWFSFAASYLATEGVLNINAILKKYFNVNKKQVIIGAIIIVSIGFILFDNPHPSGTYYDIGPITENNIILNDIKNEIDQTGEIFRIHNFETNGVGTVVTPQTSRLGLQTLYGIDGGLWIPEYMNVYLSVSGADRAKFWGLLNTKYVLSINEVNISGFKLAKKYDIDKSTLPNSYLFNLSYGPYLYENLKYLPRAFWVNKTVLLVGDDNSQLNMNYYMIGRPNFNTNNTVMVIGENKLSSYSNQELNNFDVLIILQGGFVGTEGTMLQRYKQQGGLIFPDLTAGIGSYNEEDLDNLLINPGKLTPANILKFSANSMHVEKNTNMKSLFVSEKYFMFEGWHAESKIYRANGMGSLVFSDEDVKFNYFPMTIKIGLIIFIAAILLIIFLLYTDNKFNLSRKLRKILDSIPPRSL